MEKQIYPKKWGSTVYELVDDDPSLVPSYRKIEDVSYVIQTYEGTEVVKIATPYDLVSFVYEGELEDLSINGWLASTEAVAKELLRQKIERIITTETKTLNSLTLQLKQKRELVTNLSNALEQLV